MIDAPPRRSRARLLLVLVNVVSIGSLIWTLRDAHLGDFKDDLAEMDWKWIALAVAVTLLIFVGYGVRWALVLRPVQRAGYWQTVRALYVGLFANEILPFRAGELLRCYLITRWTKLPLSVSITSAVIERIFDGIWLCLGLFVTLKLVPFPRYFRYLIDGAWTLGIVVVVGAVVLAVLMFLHWNKLREAPPASGWRKHLATLINDLGMIGHSRYLYYAFFLSAVLLVAQMIPVWAAFQGYGFDLSLRQAFALMVIVRLTSAVPQAPGNIGLFQLFTKEVLIRIFYVVSSDAARFSVVLWGIMTLPLLLGGFVALWIEEADIVTLKRAAEDEAGINV